MLKQNPENTGLREKYFNFNQKSKSYKIYKSCENMFKILTLFKGFVLTLKTLGPRIVVREVLRRIFRINYNLYGIPVRSDVTFRDIRYIKTRGYDITISDNEVIINTSYGKIGADKEDFLLLREVLAVNFDEMYGITNIKGVVIDIGAYIGETPLYFISKGASKVYAFEPVDKHYRYMIRNIERNRLINKIISINKGIWFHKGEIYVPYSTSATGLNPNGEPVKISTITLDEAISIAQSECSEIDLVKIDCEGCEYTLITLPEDIIKRAKQYIIEIHGPPLVIMDKMKKAGYKAVHVKKIEQLVNVYYFSKI